MSVQDENRIATAFLRALDAPNTPQMRWAVRAWLRAEGISSVKRNNPWNLHSGAPCHSASGFCPGKGPLSGQIGVQNVGSGDQNVAVFDTLEHGVQANANNLVRLRNSGYGYDLVIKKAQAGDAVGFLNALALSSWSAGRYGTKNGGNNRLLVIYAQMTGYGVDPKSYQSMPGYKSGFSNQRPQGEHAAGGGSGNALDDKQQRALDLLKKAGFTDLSLTHVITHDEARAIAEKLYNMNPDGQLAQQIIQRWEGKTVADFIGASVTTGDTFTNDDPLSVIAGFAGKLSDPATWARILALIVGLGLAAYGGVNVYRATA